MLTHKKKPKFKYLNQIKDLLYDIFVRNTKNYTIKKHTMHLNGSSHKHMIDPSDYLDTFDQEASMILSMLATPTNNLFLLILPYKNTTLSKYQFSN